MRCFRKQFLLVLIGYIMMIHLVIICGAENVEVKSDKSSYGGLRREFQEADVIVRLEVIDCKAVNLTADSNNNQNIAEEMEIKGKVISLFKGEISKVGDILTLYVRFADHWRSIQKFRSHCPICFTVPDKGKNAVFLVKKTRRRLEIVNIILPFYTSEEYQETSEHSLMKNWHTDDTFVRNYILLPCYKSY